jgi:nucleotide-binding universal stress UspA family protein
MAQDARPAMRVVVGVDGSEGAAAALAWAAAEATLRHSTLHVVHAWHYPATGGMAEFAGATVAWEELDGPERELLDARITELATSWPRLAVERTLAYGSAAAAIVGAAEGAELVVVGSRGWGGFTGLLLGSVSQQVAHHAPCPVVIVPCRG